MSNKEEKKRILVLPGSEWQKPLCAKICDMGHKVLLIDPHENPACKEYAYAHLQSDIFDSERIVSWAREMSVDSIISDECDIAIPAVAELAERLDLTALSRESAALFTDKHQMREFCKVNNLPSPKYKLCNTKEDAQAFLSSIEGPAIIKPLDCNSSRGVHSIGRKDDIEHFFEDSITFSRSKKAVLIEQYVQGPEFTVDGIKTKFGYFTLAISKKRHYKHNNNIACELLFTNKSEEYDYEELARVNRTIVELSGLEFGLTHAEYKYENGKYYLIEIAARGGGNLISSLITEYMSGIDAQKLLIAYSTGQMCGNQFLSSSPVLERAAVLKFFDVPDGGGRISVIHGSGVLEKIPEIAAYSFNYGVGDMLVNASCDAARAGYYIALCDSIERLSEVMRIVSENVRFEIN